MSCDYLNGEDLNLKKRATVNVSFKYFTNVIAEGNAIQKLPLFNYCSRWEPGESTPLCYRIGTASRGAPRPTPARKARAPACYPQAHSLLTFLELLGVLLSRSSARCDLPCLRLDFTKENVQRKISGDIQWAR